MIITIDGPAGTGKSTVAKGFAKALGFTYFDTGALYRMISWQVLKQGIQYEDKQALSALLENFTFDIRSVAGEKHYFVENQDVTTAIRTKEVTAIVSKISALQEVRKALKPLQVSFGQKKDVVFEGRDLGTVVFPKADLKFFLTARAEVRAKRRYKELQKKFPHQTGNYESIFKGIRERDELDSTREYAPLKQAKDASLIDTSDLTIQEVIDQMKEVYHSKIQVNKSKRAKPSILYSIVIFLIKIFFKLFYRHKVYGLEHFPEGSALIAANHVSFLDPPCIAISCPGEVHFLARQTLFKSYLGKLISALNTHPVQKETANLRVIKDVCILLKKGSKVLMFPEGTRSKDNVLKEIKPGIGLLLSKSESSILPTYVHGTYAIWNPMQKFPKLWGKTAVIFGSPIIWNDYADMGKKEAQELVAAHLTQALNSLRKWYEEGAEGIPP